MLGNILIDFIFFIVYKQNLLFHQILKVPSKIDSLRHTVTYHSFQHYLLWTYLYNNYQKYNTSHLPDLVRAKNWGTIPKLQNTANIDKVEIGNVHLFIVSFTWAVPTNLESNSSTNNIDMTIRKLALVLVAIARMRKQEYTFLLATVDAACYLFKKDQELHSPYVGNMRIWEYGLLH